MRIGINLLYLIPGRSGGTETYARALLHSLAALDQQNEYFVFFNKKSSGIPLPAASNFHRYDCSVAAIHQVFRYAWEQLVLPFHLKRLKIDVVHSLGYVMPLLAPCISLVSIPDMNMNAISEYFPLHKRILLNALNFVCFQSARRARRVITISNFSKQEIVNGIGIKPEKVIVTHLGPRLRTHNIPEVEWQGVKAIYGLPDRYIVAIGGTSKHKNIARLITAFRTLTASYPHALVIPGHVPSDVDAPAEMAKAELMGRLLCLGYVPEEHLDLIFAHADLFVLPSLYEGFGLPVLEAQQAGTPVACSAAGSLPEVAGQAAVYFDPLSTDSIAAAIRKCLDDPTLLKSLRELGRENVKRFDWQKTAQLTLETYRQAALGKDIL
jgi:glycosyltransferase involved in cell wall biosynthesis